MHEINQKPRCLIGRLAARHLFAVVLHLSVASAFSRWPLHASLWLHTVAWIAEREPMAWNQNCSSSSCLQPSQNVTTTTATQGASPRRLVEIPTGYIISGARHSLWDGGAGTVAAMLYAPAEDLLITGGDSGDVQFWKGEDAAAKSTDTALYAQTVAGAPITALTYIPGDQSIAAARDDGYIRFLRVSDRGILGEIQENNRRGLITSVEHLEYDDDVLKYVEVATSSTSPSIKLWDVQTRTLSRTFTGHKRPVLTLRFLPPLELLVSGGFDGLVCFWSLPVATKVAIGKRCTGQKTYLSTAYRERDCLASTISQGGTFFIYGLQDGTAANSCEMELSDCSELQDAEYSLFRIEEPSRFKLPGHEGAVRAIEHVSDNELAASGGDDGKVQLWDPKKGELVRTLHAPGERVLALLYISTLRVLLAGTTGGIYFFDAMSGGAALKSVPLSSQVASLSYIRVQGHQLIATAQTELLDVLLALEICVDGTRPRSPAECELCPSNLAGENGICQIPCRSGFSSNENRTVCAACKPGSGGVDGFCELCAEGRFQDEPGRLSCTPCTKGYAQPLRGQTSCAACVDNTVAEVDGQANCVECPDGKEPSRDQSRCQACPEGTAGTRGLCFQCQDGQQPNILQSACVSCPTGTAGTKGSCTRCPDGNQPAEGLTECEACPLGEAGRKGTCKRCVPGQTPEPGSAFCMNCPPGEAGTNGTCTACAAGYVPVPDRTSCEECPDKQPSFRGNCIPCADGTEPADNRSACLPCGRGQAGKRGICSRCKPGFEAAEDKSRCVPCDDTSASSDGVCEPCEDGTQPNENKTVCDPCEPGTAGVAGRCEPCGDGQQQNYNGSICERCPLGKAGLGGICKECNHPKIQNQERTHCTVRPLPPYYVFFDPRCSGHPVCKANFEHHLGEDYFCCPTPEGDNLDCCQFESETTEKFWRRLTGFIGRVVRMVSRAIWLFPVLASMACVPVGYMMYRVSTHEDWEDWRENLKTTYLTVFLFFCGFPAIAVIVPWLIMTVLLLGWLWVVTIILYTQVYLMIVRSTACLHYERPTAIARLRKYWGLLFLVDIFCKVFEFVHQWLLLHALWMSMIGFVFGSNMPIAFEQVVKYLALPWMAQYALDWVIFIMRGPQVFLESILVHINHHTDNFTVTLFAAAAMTQSVMLSSYILLAGDVLGRITAAKQGILLSYVPSRAKIQWMFIYGVLDYFFMLFMHWSALCSACLVPQLIMLAPEGRVPKQSVEGLARFSAWFLVGMTQVFALLTWIVIAGGAHLDNPPFPLSHWLRRSCGVQFLALRREQFIIRSVLRGLGLYDFETDGPEDVDSQMSGSPRSSTSPRSPSMSPRGSSSPSMSPRPGRTSTSSGAGDMAGQKDAAAQARKVLKNFGSVRRLLRQLDPSLDDDGSPRNSEFGMVDMMGGSPTSSPRQSGFGGGRRQSNFGTGRRQSNFGQGGLSSSPRAGQGRRMSGFGAVSRVSSMMSGGMSPNARMGMGGKVSTVKLASQMGANSCRKPVNFVRLPDGTHADLTQQRSARRGDGSEMQSPGRSSFSPGGRSTQRSSSPTNRSSFSPQTSPGGRMSTGRASTRSGSPNARRDSSFRGGGSQAVGRQSSVRGGSPPQSRLSSSPAMSASPSGRDSQLRSPKGGASGRDTTSGRDSFVSQISPEADGSRSPGGSSPVGHYGSQRSSRLSRSSKGSDASVSEFSEWYDDTRYCWRLRRCYHKVTHTRLYRFLCRVFWRLIPKIFLRQEIYEADGSGRLKVSYDARKGRQIMTLDAFDLLDSQGNDPTKTDLAEFTVTPQQLYDRMPKGEIVLTIHRLFMMVRRSLHTCWSVCMGQWKDGWNITPLRLRLRTRDYAKEVWRKNYDQEDYRIMEYATARNIGAASLALPGGAVFWALALYLNKPPFRHYDDKLDIIQHKVEEYVDRGTSHKQAMITIMRKLVSRPEHRWRKRWMTRCNRFIFLLNLSLLFCLLVMAAGVNGDNAFWLLPPLGLIAIMSIFLKSILESLAIPVLMLPQTITISVRREMDDEKKIMDQVREAIGSEESSTTEDSMSDYSSANESFLDEDPRSTATPSVLGVKNAKVIVRPKAARLKLRFKLQQCLPAYGEHLRRWRREEPLKHCPLLQVPGAYPHTSPLWRNYGGYALRRERSVAFAPTEASDWPLKVQKFRLQRCHSLGTITAREAFVFRQENEKWSGYFDIFEERAKPGIPSLPAQSKDMPDRGLVDQFEAQRVFIANTEENTKTNKQMFFGNPFADTRVGRGFTRATRWVLGREQPAKPKWEMSYDEELARSTDSITALIEEHGLREQLDNPEEAAKVKHHDPHDSTVVDREGRLRVSALVPAEEFERLSQMGHHHSHHHHHHHHHSQHHHHSLTMGHHHSQMGHHRSSGRAHDSTRVSSGPHDSSRTSSRSHHSTRTSSRPHDSTSSRPHDSSSARSSAHPDSTAPASSAKEEE